MPPPKEFWEALVVGGGPAGLAAGLHLSRAGYSALLVERDRLGGQAGRIGLVENYPGFPNGIDGSRLMELWVRQARRWGLKTKRGEVRSIARRGQDFELRLAGGGRLMARCVIYCPGTGFKALGLRGEGRFRGAGVFHAAFLDAPRWRGRTVAVAGGGEAAAHQALALARHARRVYLICRGGRLKAHRLLLRRLQDEPAVVRIMGAQVAALEGRRRLEAVLLEGAGGGLRLPVDALFVLVGKEPPRPPYPVDRFPKGFFLAGDAAAGAFRQVAVAAGSGIQAAMRAISLLESRPA